MRRARFQWQAKRIKARNVTSPCTQNPMQQPRSPECFLRNTQIQPWKDWRGESQEKKRWYPLRGHLQTIFPLPHLLFVRCEGSKQDIPKPSLTSWFGLRFAFASLCSKTKEEKQIWKFSKPNNPWANNKHVHMYIVCRGAFPFPTLSLAAWRWKKCLERYITKMKYCKR